MTNSNAAIAAKSICVIGLGLIGGSFALALKNAGHTGRISALVRTPRTGERALELGVVDAVSDDIATAVADVDVVMLAVPMLGMRDQLEKLKPVLAEHTIVTDAGSVKGSFVKDAQCVFSSMRRIVPGHPIAGLEKSGIDAVDAKLYQNKRVLLTPLADTAAEAVDTVSALWQQAGAEVESLSPEHHDRVLALTSHLPHVLAFALVDMLADQQQAEEIFRYSAGGFRDFTRIASGDAIMWRDICLTNREPLGRAIDQLGGRLTQLREAIEQGDAEAIESVFERARSARNQHIVKPKTS